MPTFTYSARSRDGRKVDGTLEAADRRAALAALARMDCVPVRIVESGGAAAKPAGRPAAGGVKARFKFTFRRDNRPHMSMREMLLFTRELSDLLASGMTLGEALHTLSRRGASDESSTALTTELRDEIVRGSSLSEALSAHPETFPLPLHQHGPGRRGGRLARRGPGAAGASFRTDAGGPEKVLMALTYPAIVLIIGGLTTLFIMVFVIPRFASMFAELGSTLPLPTRILIGMSHGFTGIRGLILLAVAIAAIIGIRRTLRSERGRAWWHRTQLRVPVVGRVASAAAYTHFAQTLGSLLANGVPVLQALSIVEQTVGNSVIARESTRRGSGSRTGPASRGRWPRARCFRRC
jgi:type II secretory pathway component PulF